MSKPLPDWFLEFAEACGHEICPRCRCCDLVSERCTECDGDGGYEEEDGINGDYWVRCDWCDGRGSRSFCLGPCDDDGNHEPEAPRAAPGEGE